LVMPYINIQNQAQKSNMGVVNKHEVNCASAVAVMSNINIQNQA